MFTRSKKEESPTTPQVIGHAELAELYGKLGRLEANVETLELKWSGYRDEIKRLVNRLEKRDERAEKKREASESIVSDDPELPGVDVDEFSKRVMARRRRSGNHVPESR